MKSKLLLLFCTFFYTFNVFSQVPASFPSNGLIGYWYFNGNANDVSGNNNHGTVSNAILTTDRFGKPNSAYQFDGKTSRIDIDTAFFNSGWSGFTISCWINSSSIENPNNSNNGHNIINTNPHNGIALNQYSSSNPFNPLWNNKYVVLAGSQPDLRNWDIIFDNGYSNTTRTINTWNHLALVKDGTTYSFYVNGILDKVIIGKKQAESFLSKIVIGNLAMKDDISNESFLGKLDDYAIYSTSLTSTEIVDLYKAETSSIDLSLSSFSQNRITQKDSTGTISFTIKNEGQSTATNIKVLLKIPYSPPFVIKNSQNCTKGTFDSNIWTIPALASGDSCILNVVYQPKQSGVWYVEAEVFSADQNDRDSKVNNGIDTEDDFARACMSIPIKISNDVFGMQLLLEDSKIDILQWFKDGNAISGANQSTLQVTALGKYSYNTKTYICPEQGCCPFILEKASIPTTCCIPLEYILERKN